MRSGLPGVNYGHTYGLKVIHISGHNRHAVNKGSGRDESVTIGARTGHVERGAPLGGRSHPRFPRRFSELAVFDARFYIGVRCVDEPG